jgi:hypothetical protein
VFLPLERRPSPASKPIVTQAGALETWSNGGPLKSNLAGLESHQRWDLNVSQRKNIGSSTKITISLGFPA